MKTLVTEIEIQASPEQVWNVLTDFDSYPDWNPFIPYIKGILKPYAKLTVQITPPEGRVMTFRPEIQQVENHIRYYWLGSWILPGLLDGEHHFEIHPMGQGKVRFEQWERFYGLLVPVLWRMIKGPTRQGFQAMNTALKQRVEALIAQENQRQDVTSMGQPAQEVP